MQLTIKQCVSVQQKRNSRCLLYYYLHGTNLHLCRPRSNTQQNSATHRVGTLQAKTRRAAPPACMYLAMSPNHPSHTHTHAHTHTYIHTRTSAHTHPTPTIFTPKHIHDQLVKTTTKSAPTSPPWRAWSSPPNGRAGRSLSRRCTRGIHVKPALGLPGRWGWPFLTVLPSPTCVCVCVCVCVCAKVCAGTNIRGTAHRCRS